MLFDSSKVTFSEERASTKRHLFGIVEPMHESVAASLNELFIYGATGFLIFQPLQRLIPMKRRDPRPNYLVDAIYFIICGGVYRFLYLEFIEPLVFGFPSVRGFAWLESVHLDASQWPASVTFLVSLIVADFLGYWFHRLQHVPGFWHVHAAHHASSNLYWASGMKSSFFHIVLLYAPYSLVDRLIPVGGAWGWAILILYYANQHYSHSNLRLNLGPIGWLLVMPDYHFVHHSADRKIFNRNFGFIFTVWDRMFGTYTDPRSLPEDHPLGISYKISNMRLILGLPPPRPERAVPRWGDRVPMRQDIGVVLSLSTKSNKDRDILL